MNIGIDIDGVIQDTETRFRSDAEIFDIVNNGNGIRKADASKVQERMGWEKQLFERFVYEKMFGVMETAPLMPNTKEVVDWLKSKGHRLVVITARGTFSNIEIDIANKMLKRNGLEFDKLYFNAQDKLIPCTEEKIDYMIDDSVSNIKRLSENGIKCLYFRRNDSKEIIHKNVTQVLNWGEVFRFFCDK